MARDIEAIRKVLQTVPPKVTKATVDADVEALGAEICMLADSGHTAKDIAALLVQAGFGAGQQTLVQSVRKLLKGGAKTVGPTKLIPKRQKRAAVANAAQVRKTVTPPEVGGFAHINEAAEGSQKGDDRQKASARGKAEF